MDVVERLNEIMRKQHISDYKLAKISGLSLSTLSNMRKRNTVPSIVTLEIICKALNITLTQFFASEDDDLYPVTPLQREFMDYYVLMSDEQQHLFLEMAKNTDINPETRDLKE